MSYKYVPEKEEPEYSERIKLIQQAHEEEGFEYIPNENDSETLREIAYIRFAKRNPGSASQHLLAVYREKADDGKEWMLWKVKYIVLDKDDRPFEAEVWLGKKPKLETVPIKDDDGRTINKRIRNWKMEYLQPWDKKKFAEIMKEFISTKTNFYLSTISENFFQNFGGTSIMIDDKDKYANSTYDELIAYDNEKAKNQHSKVMQTRTPTTGKLTT